MFTSSTTRTEQTIPAPAHAGRGWEVTRVLLGLVYLLGAVAHVAIGLLAPEVYEEFADQALLSVYTDLWVTLVVPNLVVLQPLVVVFEIVLGAVLLWRGWAVRAGHVAGAVFQIGLILSGPWGPINALLAVIHLAAARVSYPLSVVALARRFLGGRESQ